MFVLDITVLSAMVNATTEEGLLQKGWSDDPRIAPHGPQNILDRYWEGGHALHSAQSAAAAN